MSFGAVPDHIHVQGLNMRIVLIAVMACCITQKPFNVPVSRPHRSRRNWYRHWCIIRFPFAVSHFDLQMVSIVKQNA